MQRKSKLKGAHGWLIVLGAVAAIDLLAQEGQTLSEALHAGRRRHPVIVTTAVLATAFHLLLGDHPTLGRFDSFRLRFPVIKILRRLHPVPPPTPYPTPVRPSESHP
jgi:plasmid stabilization system protein ParE